MKDIPDWVYSEPGQLSLHGMFRYRTIVLTTGHVWRQDISDYVCMHLNGTALRTGHVCLCLGAGPLVIRLLWEHNVLL